MSQEDIRIETVEEQVEIDQLRAENARLRDRVVSLTVENDKLTEGIERAYWCLDTAVQFRHRFNHCQDAYGVIHLALSALRKADETLSAPPF